MCSSDIFLVILAVFFPPIAVWVKCGICSADSVINILLCMLGYVPGLLHAWYIVAKFPDSSEYEAIPPDAENARVTYVVVQPGPNGQPRKQPRTGAPNNGYGTTAPPVAPQQHQEANGTWAEPSRSGESSCVGTVPPSYDEAIRGDNKVQTR